MQENPFLSYFGGHFENDGKNQDGRHFHKIKIHGQTIVSVPNLFIYVELLMNYDHFCEKNATLALFCVQILARGYLFILYRAESHVWPQIGILKVTYLKKYMSDFDDSFFVLLLSMSCINLK